MGTIVSFGNAVVGFGSSGVIVGAPASPVSPFDVVSDDDFNPQVQIKWNSIPDYNSSYRQTNRETGSMLYRKVKVNSAVHVTSYTVNTNQGAQSVGKDVTVNVGTWPSAGTIYGSDLTKYVINSSETGNREGSVYTYYVPGPSGKTYTWTLFTVNCNITLQPGYYWWPLFPQRHGNPGASQFGFHDSVGPCDLMQLYNSQDPNADASKPPVYSSISTTPYLHLTDSDGNEYSV